MNAEHAAEHRWLHAKAREDSFWRKPDGWPDMENGRLWHTRRAALERATATRLSDITSPACPWCGQDFSQS